MKPLVDGHGRAIGDVRDLGHGPLQLPLPVLHARRGVGVAATRALLTYEEIERLVRLLSPMGVHDVRLTGGEPLVRGSSRSWSAAVGDRGGRRPVADDQRLPALARGRRPRGRRTEPHQRLARLARARPLLRAHAPRRAEQVLEGSAAAERHPELRPIKVNVVALRDFTEDEVVRFAEFARKHPYEVRFIEFMPLDADRHGTRTACCPTRRSGG